MTYAAGHGLFLAAAVASMHGDLVRHTLALGGDGGGVFGLDSRGPATVTVTRGACRGPAGRRGRGRAGRARPGRRPAWRPAGQDPSRPAALPDFFNTPVTPPG